MSGTIRKHVTGNDFSRLFRLPAYVTEYRKYGNGDLYPVCPACKQTLDRDFQRFCDRCGQFLDWSKY